MSVDNTYRKELEAAVVGFCVLVIPLFFDVLEWFDFRDEESHRQADVIYTFIKILIATAIAFWVVKIAKRQNRNEILWGVLAFILPGLILIIIGLLNKKPLVIKLDTNLSAHDQSEVLISKAKGFKKDGRFHEALVLLEEIKKINPAYPDLDSIIETIKKNITTSEINYKRSQEKLITGEIIEVKIADHTDQVVGAEVLVDGLPPKDGVVRLLDKDYRYEIKNGRISNEYFIEYFKQPDGCFLEIDTTTVLVFGRKTRKGSRAWLNNLPAPDGVYKAGLFKKLKVKDGLILKSGLNVSDSLS
jgi:hypothetical protein